MFSSIFEDIILSPWLVLVILGIALFVLTRWAVFSQKEYPGYALGWLVAVFFIVVFEALGGGPTDSNIIEPGSLTVWQVFISTFLGLTFGGLVLVGIRFGGQLARGIALQVALYTALNVILLFLLVVQGPVAQRMIGIFALAFGIMSLFVIVLFPGTVRPSQSGQSEQGQNQQTPRNSNRLHEMRQQMQNRDHNRP